MADIYDKAQALATRLLTKNKQGVITYNEPGSTTGDAWNPTEGAATAHTLNATASGVSKQYIDSKTILESDLMVTSAVFDVTPVMTGTVTVDGKEHQIISIKAVPAAGTTAAWRLIIRA